MNDIDKICEDIVITAENGGDAEDMRRILIAGPVLEETFEHSLAIEHVLGFAQLRLGSYEGRLVRIHIWPAVSSDERSDPTSDVHSHMWPLHSYILGGWVENSLFDVMQTPDGPGEMFEVRYSSKASHRVPVGARVRWEMKKAEQVTRGMRYSVGADDFHASRVGPKGSVTLVVTGLRSRRSPLVVRAVDPSPLPEDCPLRPIPVVRLRQLLERMRQAIS